MIFLDAERFIEEAIESVFAQTWPQWELLLVDDGSADRSAAIAERYAVDHPDRVRYLQHPGHANRGMSASRNLGIAHARGAYIAFLDADDVYLPERLARHVEILKARPSVDVVQSTMIAWYTWALDGQKDHVLPSIGPLHVVSRPPTMLASYLNSRYSPNLCSMTVRTRAVIEVGGFENAFTDWCEDRVLLTKLYATRKAYVIDEVLAKYRRHPASLTGRSGDPSSVSRRYDAYSVWFEWVNDHMRSCGIDNSSLYAAVARQRQFEDERYHKHREPKLTFGGGVKAFLKRLSPPLLRKWMAVRRANWHRGRDWRRVNAEMVRMRREHGAAAGSGGPELRTKARDDGGA